MSRFPLVDLAALPPPKVIEEIDFEALFGAARGDFVTRFQAAAGVAYTALRDSDPGMLLLQTGSYREMILRERVNAAARAVLLPFAQGADLDNLAAFFAVARLTRAADPSAVPPVEAWTEGDAAFRRRIQLAPAGYAVAGPRDAYLYHTLSASADIADAGVQSPVPGDVLITLLPVAGADGAALVALIARLFAGNDLRPMGDKVIVELATILPYAIHARLTLYGGPADQPILAAAQAAVTDLAARSEALGVDITQSALTAALHQPGCKRVELLSPPADITVSSRQAARCVSIQLETIVAVEP